MRRRRKSFASFLFLLIALALLGLALVFAIPLLVERGWLAEGVQAPQLVALAMQFIKTHWDFIWRLMGAFISASGFALGLLATWHFAEINLPSRLEDLQRDLEEKHLKNRAYYLAAARTGRLGMATDDMEKSRFTLLRAWLSFFSKYEQARVLAASHILMHGRSSALQSALKEAQERLITAHLIRGYQYASNGEDKKASKEFESAVGVRDDDIPSRDIAAGWARQVNDQKLEERILAELDAIAEKVDDDLARARTWRRQAELLNKRQTENDWKEARRKLDQARRLLTPIISNEGKIELGRVLTLFGEVQCSRLRIGNLGPALTAMQTIMASVKMHTRTEERHGEVYGDERAHKLSQRVSELRGDADVDEVGDGAG